MNEQDKTLETETRFRCLEKAMILHAGTNNDNLVLSTAENFRNWIQPAVETVRTRYQMEPEEPGFYKYSGGRQNMVFLLIDREVTGLGNRIWCVINDSGVIEECDWGYIAQGLGEWDLIRIESVDKE